jgi:4-aminobutyrate aminotransferase-like enzyme
MLPRLVSEVPGPESRRLAALLRRYESRNVTCVTPGFPVFWERAHGVNVWDVDGNRFLDLTSGFGVAGLGYTPEPVVAAIRDQATKLYHAMGDVHPTAEKAELCRKLSALTFEAWTGRQHGGKVILANSGTEAVEAALKTAFLATGRAGVVSFTGGYHGLGYGALAAGGLPFFRKPFEAQLAKFSRIATYPYCHHCPLAPEPREPGQCVCEPAWEKAFEELTRGCEIGAILVEPIQARAGEVVPPDWFLPRLRQWADDRGALLIFDEIFTGWHRTGARFGCDHWEVVPDVVCVGKALTSGFPLSACIGRADLMDRAWPESTGEALHTSTFLGNPLGCRMALVSLELIERGEEVSLSERVARAGSRLVAGLKAVACRHGLGPVRGRGLLIGLEVPAGIAGRCVEGMLARGVFLLPGGIFPTLSFCPPFAISDEEMDFACAAIDEVLVELH